MQAAILGEGDISFGYPVVRWSYRDEFSEELLISI
jgi:hypothetical protein